MRIRVLLVAAFIASQTVAYHAATPIHYTLTFPEPQHRWMQVEASFTDLASTPLELRMSRSSPGRYSLHDFAKNVYDVHVFARDGRELDTTRPDPYGWNVSGGHGGGVTVKYKIFGDTIDGTYLAVDETHAHINMPAAIMWAHGLDDRPITMTFVEPAGGQWKVATQLHPGSTPLEFTAPNLQYLMDSPAEFGPVAMREFSVGDRKFRFAVHHQGTDAELDGFVADVEKIVRQEGAIYGEFPQYEPGYYTFLAEYLPWSGGDGMEHRNSTVMTSRRSIHDAQALLLDTVAHEFFHCWNVERIRPRSLEPFDFDRANMSGELWLAEGFTQYYGPLAMERAGLMDTTAAARGMTGLIESVAESPGHLVRSAEEMSRMAPFVDGGTPNDRTNWSNTVISYYPFGGAIALALDLSLRDRSDGKVSLDDFMRAMWRVHGKPGGAHEGYVDHSYTMADAEARLAEVSGNRQFARDFFAHYIQGHDVADYGRLLARAGFTLRKRHAGAAWWGDVGVASQGSPARIVALVPANSPAYAAGLEQDDELQQIDGQKISAAADVQAIVSRHKIGDRIDVVYVDRTGKPKTVAVTLAEDPHQEVVPVETAGGTLTPQQQAFRAAWLGPK